MLQRFQLKLFKGLYKRRAVAKRAVAMLHRLLPRALSRPLTSLVERVAFKVLPDYQADTLPPIFDYWSNTHLQPELRKLGFDSPEDFFLKQAIKQARQTRDGPLQMLSLGSGAAHLELTLLRQLAARDIAADIECVDFNPALKTIAEKNAADLGLAERLTFKVRDCNKPGPPSACDLIVVNQFFHHVERLEDFCAAIAAQLRPDGVLVTSDVIGRNGHVLWPSVDAHVQQAWRGLPQQQRFDRYFWATQSAYRSVDHASYSNEGIRAQDIVASLLHHFDFELFVAYGGAIMPFVERRIGFNFSPESESDRRFIDDLARADGERLARAEYPASNMIAALRHKGRAPKPVHRPISPHTHLQLARREASRARPQAG